MIAVLVVFGGEDEFGSRILRSSASGTDVMNERRGDGDPTGDGGMFGAEDHGCSERVSDQPQWAIVGHGVDGRYDVIVFGPTAVVSAPAGTTTAEVEANGVESE